MRFNNKTHNLYSLIDKLEPCLVLKLQNIVINHISKMKDNMMNDENRKVVLNSELCQASLSARR